MAIKKSKIALFTISLLPVAWLVYGVFANKLGANPIEYIIRDLGEWGLRFLLLTLCITPLRVMGQWPSLAQYRRMLGLFAFFYVFLHLTIFIVVDLSGSMSALWHEIVKRKFITVGMLAFIILIPLAITSVNKIIKRMGAARWKTLHKGVYVASILAVLHFYWMAKADKTEPLIYAAILAVLLGYRVYAAWAKSRKKKTV